MPRTYRKYTIAEREQIVSSALKEGLSATKVRERFGVVPVTYYSWRKARGIRSSRGRPPRVTTGRTEGKSS
jgi:transposase-like protein